ncbi:MAG: rRNA maturation RNase YbeY [Thermodesulfovibrionia bacterium]
MRILIKNLQRQRPLNKKRIAQVARSILSLMGKDKAELSILFVNDKRMLMLNHQYRGINKSTDVLSFEVDIPLSDYQRGILGDVVINVNKVEEQADISGVGFYDELYRLLIHGILHLIGYDHEDSRYRAGLMRKREREIFNAIKKVY